MAHYAHLFTPIQIGTMTVANRICHVPTDVSSSNADGSVSERDIHHHSEIAKGGAGLIIVGATSPDGATGRPTVTDLSRTTIISFPVLRALRKACISMAQSALFSSSIPAASAQFRATIPCPRRIWS